MRVGPAAGTGGGACALLLLPRRCLLAPGQVAREAAGATAERASRGWRARWRVLRLEPSRRRLQEGGRVPSLRPGRRKTGARCPADAPAPVPAVLLLTD